MDSDIIGMIICAAGFYLCMWRLGVWIWRAIDDTRRDDR